MDRLNKIEGQIRKLPAEELRLLRAWLAEYDADAWDGQFASDVADGKLDRMADRALRDHEAGRSARL